MKQKIIKALKISGIFMLGLIIGGVLMNLLHMYVRSTYRETIRIDLNTEQKFLAGRAAREGDKLRALSHQWNVVDTEAKDGFRAFQKERNKEIDSSFFFPFVMVVLDEMVRPIGGMQGKSARISEGIERGKLALYLESIGKNQEGEKQWEMARALTNKKSTEDIRKLILKLREQETTDAYLQAERAILDDKAKAQQ
jgi:hypothetical protein